jgi:hypothetical protein
MNPRHGEWKYKLAYGFDEDRKRFRLKPGEQMSPRQTEVLDNLRPCSNES